MAGHYRLTDKQVQNAAPEAGQGKLKLQDGAGLTLVVRAKDRKYWTLRVVADGKTREVGMGSAAGAYAVSLADALDKAFELRKLLREGVAFNDALARVAKRKALWIAGSQPTAGGMTFEQHARAYIQQHLRVVEVDNPCPAMGDHA